MSKCTASYTIAFEFSADKEDLTPREAKALDFLTDDCGASAAPEDLIKVEIGVEVNGDCTKGEDKKVYSDGEFDVTETGETEIDDYYITSFKYSINGGESVDVMDRFNASQYDVEDFVEDADVERFGEALADAAGLPKGNQANESVMSNFMDVYEKIISECRRSRWIGKR